MSSSKPKLNESALVCAARQGDRQALQKLLETHWRWLKGLLYSILGNADDVDEALQSVCVLVLGKIGWRVDLSGVAEFEAGLKLFLPVSPFSSPHFQYNEMGGIVTDTGTLFGGDLLRRMVTGYLQGSF